MLRPLADPGRLSFVPFLRDAMSSTEPLPVTSAAVLPAEPGRSLTSAISADPPRSGTGPTWQAYVGFVLVAALAFLLASFPARHSDLWQHLASGRALVHGQTDRDGGAGLAVVHPGNRSWLFDLTCYGLYTALGGTGLMIVKALVVVAIGVLLLRLSRAGGGWIIAAGCIALALLVMGTRLLWQPALVSCFFLALTLVLLHRQEQKSVGRPPPLLPPWPLIVLFLLWVNTDAWFVLGLAVVGLVWLGRTLDEEPGGDGSRLTSLLRRTGALVILAAACLLNPAHIHAFSSLRDLGAVPDATTAAAAVTSPFQKAYLQLMSDRPAGLAYYPLLFLGLLSFGLNLRRPVWQRLLPFLALAILTAVQVRTMPFFAVVAGPVLAANLQAWWARRPAGPAGRAVPAGWQSLALIPLILVVICAWPGWLQGGPYQPRRWTVEAPPALELAAAEINRWHADRKLPDGTRGLHFSSDSFNTLAWLAPQDDGIMDPTLSAAIPHLTLLSRARDGAGYEAARQRLRAARIDHVIIHDASPTRFHAALGLFLTNSQDWALLFLEGNVAIFGWRDLGAPLTDDPFRGRLLDLQRLAFKPPRDKQAPPQGPEREPQARSWWEALDKPAPVRPIEQDEAAVYLLYARLVAEQAGGVRAMRWQLGQQAAAIAAAGGWAGRVTPAAALLDAHVRLLSLQPSAPAPGLADGLAALRREVVDWYRLYELEQDDEPSALVYLAIRAARRAIAVNPDDADAYLVLGQGYLSLLGHTRERAWASQMPDLVELRRVQASAALNRVLVLRPGSARAHRGLADLYRDMGYLDLALEHLQAYVRSPRQAGPAGDGSAEVRRQQEANRGGAETADARGRGSPKCLRCCLGRRLGVRARHPG